MTCTECGEQASGRFCNNCGAATGQGSPVDVAEEKQVPQSVLDEAVKKALTEKATSDLEEKVSALEASKKSEMNIQAFGFMLLMVGVLLWIFFA